MILNNTPQNEAIVSNVGEIGEFRIRNSAKAFNILSSGLYANKIKAIIRELSCNAVDSHIAAGNETPFEVHLPTFLEPYFAVRDYGTGLNHDQVKNIYTTYFESTKTNSNDYIGALGLGSKSPFSYTDNFTVTAIKDGRKGIYTAFINGEGVPSIALMTEEQTNEPNGVEIRFAVESQFDFNKFESEAGAVYRWFKQLPVFTGKTPHIPTVEYIETDLIPGVSVSSSIGTRSVAVMGNISYPIEVPQADKVLDGLQGLLNGGLVIQFDIGELDFQASREGLSYIPSTVEAIKNKLTALNARLATFVAEEADKIDNLWERSYYLNGKKNHTLFNQAVLKYVTDTDFPLIDVTRFSYYGGSKSPSVPVKDLAGWNIMVRGFHCSRNYTTCSNLKMIKVEGERDADGNRTYTDEWEFPVARRAFFIENDTNVGALERSKYHWRNDEKRENDDVFVLEKIDKTQPMNLVAFYNAIYNPPVAQKMKASSLRQKQRAASTGGLGKNVTILRLQERGGSRWHSASRDLVWRDAGKVNEFDDTKTYYYIPLSGFVPQWTKMANSSASEFVQLIHTSGVPELQNIIVYGVRKGDIEDIKKHKNWVNVESYVEKLFTNLNQKLILGVVLEQIGTYAVMKHNIKNVLDGITDDKSKAVELLSQFVGVPKSLNHFAFTRLAKVFNDKIDVAGSVNKYKSDFQEFVAQYPLIEKLDYSASEFDVIHYINLVDKTV